MLISRAFAGHFTPGTGSTGGGDALLIILGVGLVLGVLHMAWKRWRQRMQARDRGPDSGVQ